MRTNIVHPVIVIMKGGIDLLSLRYKGQYPGPQGKCGFPFVNEACYKSSISEFVSTNKDTYFSLPTFKLIHGINVLIYFANGQYKVTALYFIRTCAVFIMLCS